jgi:hypothetical protein
MNQPIGSPSNPLGKVVALLSGLLVVNLIAVFLLLQLLPQSEVAVVPKWEYRCESVSDSYFESGMNRLGAEGWEMVAARRASGSDDEMSYEMIFKRPVAKNQASPSPK